MRSTAKSPRAVFSSFARLVLLAPTAAIAAEVGARTLEREWASDTFWWLFGGVQLLWAIGYCSSSLPKWGKWIDGDASTADKLAVVAGVLCALLAGNAAYYLGYYEAGLARLYCLLAAAGGGFMGERYLTPLFSKMMPIAPAGPK
jgi:hypothetical protein